MTRIPTPAVLALVVLAPALLWAEPERPAKYPVPPDAGKWMICAASFTGPDARESAEQFAEQLRTRDRLAAYTFSWTDQERKKLKEELDRVQKEHPELAMRRRRTIRVEEQWAVLVGGWADIDDARAELEKVKKLPLPEIRLASNRPAYEQIFFGEPDEAKKQTAIRQAVRNPLQTAMVVRNPAAPADPKPVQKFDPFWKELNAGEPYNLLKNRKPWTLVVAEYQGASVLQPKAASGSFWDKFWAKPGVALNAAGQQANEVARVLRELKFEAYAFHMRHASIVTVGGFDSPEDPELRRTQARLATLKIDPIRLFAQPLPMEVPRP